MAARGLIDWIPLKALALAVLTLLRLQAAAQGMLLSKSTPQAVPPPIPTSIPKLLACPGSFPTDLTVLNCRYTSQLRLGQFISTGLTDQAMSLSIVGSAFTQAIHSPGEWPRTWKYYGYRVGSSYTGSVGRAAAEFIVGHIVRDDPRHVKCSDDPLFFDAHSSNAHAFSCTVRQRVLHALIDSVSVRKSSDGEPVLLEPSELKIMDQRKFHSTYRRLPAWSRLAGVYGGSYAEYPWEPRNANSFGAISQRAALSFGTTFLGSFYTEFSSSIFGVHKKSK
jgi:hypothetical protein